MLFAHVTYLYVLELFSNIINASHDYLYSNKPHNTHDPDLDLLTSAIKHLDILDILLELDFTFFQSYLHYTIIFDDGDNVFIVGRLFRETDQFVFGVLQDLNGGLWGIKISIKTYFLQLAL